ncbi:MAG: RNA polymerase sigma factor [Chloroflexota bacterium]|nr:RNA polymerase sigma factor [Chloroflexota bacterium]
MQAGLGAEPMSLNNIIADQAAFQVWYELALPRVYRYILARCGGDADLAEELTQQTFVDGVRQRASFDGRSDAVTWLCGIGRHKLVDHFRRSRRDTERQLRIVSEWSAGQSQPWSQHELRSDIETALAKLPGEQRIVMVLRYLDQMPVREIASTIGRSEKATESLLSRGREAFRKAYGATNS